MRYVALLLLVGCTDLSLDPPKKLVHARFDPDARVIPMPTDVLRDASLGRLDLPNDTADDLAKLTPAEKEFYDYLETLDGWSTLMSGSLEFTGPVDPTSLDGNLEVWHWGDVPERVMDVRPSWTMTKTGHSKLAIDPPREGWQRGDRYVMFVRGGDHGVKGMAGERVECDAAFYFLRQTQQLDTPQHEHAFPGVTHDERMANAHKLEKIREDLAPAFDFLEANGTPRSDVAALWAFTVTKKTELAMDQPSQRIPLPIDLLIDPATGKINAPAAPWDSATEAEAKGRLSDFDGAGLSGSQLFEFTEPLDPTTINETSVQLYQLDSAAKMPVPVPATVELLTDKVHLVVTPKAGRLAEKTRYAVVVNDAVRDTDGNKPVVMPIGHFLKSQSAIEVGDESQVSAIADADAKKLEISRTELTGALDALGRDHVLGAWPFTTMSVAEPLVAMREKATTLSLSPDPANTSMKTPGDALLDFPFGIGSIVNVGKVYYGTIQTANYLDPTTRAWRTDGSHTTEDIKFTMTVPKNATGPMPVVIFGHGLVTERRFVLAVGDALAAKGYAAISIDFPYHGDRTYCATGGPISVVNPMDGSLASLNPCASGSTCNDQGKCVDAQGNGNHLATWGVINMPVASGARFLEIDHIANSKDHFQQALIDLGALDRSLRLGNWQQLTGRPIDTSHIYYAGQSLGGIMGAVFLGTNPDISRAVLNVPGAGLIPLFDDSTFFS
ncbi:MAG: Ig-like domain-containing protein, partial [Deltaproteobacteria bacterium]|nr:Ig-like domain-containing protein [Deltaproteobacteria bacterium]